MIKQIIIVTFAHFMLTIGSYAGSTMGLGVGSVQNTMSKYAVEMMQASRYLSQPAFDLVITVMPETNSYIGPVLMLNSLFWGVLLVGLFKLIWLAWN
ncbi:MAG: hypothetical protein ACR2P6_06805 [Gammaproteobacteria bacterium]